MRLRGNQPGRNWFRRLGLVAQAILTPVAVPILLLLGASSAQAATTFHLSPTGSDSNPGTAAAPWRSFERALPALKCGDTLTVSGTAATPYVPKKIDGEGDPALTFDPSSVQDCAAGTRITVLSAGGADPEIKGLVRFNNLHNWTFSNIDVRWNRGQYTEHLLKLQGGRGWVWTDSEVSHANSFANVLVAPTSAGPPHDWTISRNCIHDNIANQDPNGNNRSHGLYIGTLGGSTGGLITRNIVFNVVAGQGIKLHSGDGVKSPSDVDVTYNTISNVSEQGILVATDARENLLTHNLIAHARGGAAVRGYGLTNSTNVLGPTASWAAGKVVQYYPTGGTLIDQRGHVSADPGFDSTTSCDGFRPTNAVLQPFGRWG
jgi:hypothetical protein